MKSNASDYLELLDCIYKDAVKKCTADVSDLRDLVTIRSRVKTGGISFLTISLPSFCNDFERSLAEGFIGPRRFLYFRKVPGGRIPAFLQGMVSQVFDRETGRLRSEQHEPPHCGKFMGEISTVIEGIRQICLAFKKVEIPCSPKRVQDSLDSFISTEQSLEMFSAPTEDRSDFIGVASVLWHNLVADISVADCTPKHGPGATAERISGNGKYRWQRWHQRLEPYFPLVDMAYPLGMPADCEELNLLTLVSEDDEQPVRVVQVPKTLKGPRIIAIEPCCMQYTQQGIRDVLYERLEKYWLTRRHVNFRDQRINQRRAMTASRTGRYATIDLSDASDRVPRDLALEMFRSNPDLRDAIDACRSTRAELPDGRLVSPLRKFASMGSALCFPIEAMYFYTICVVAILRQQGLPATPRNCFKATRGLYVYGDDIIVPTTYADTVLDHLQKYNCKVNTNKTFVTGKFRESCGVDAYAGYEVTPTYIRQVFPENRRQFHQIISWVKTANQLYKKGYWESATFMFNKLEGLIGFIPYVDEKSDGLGRTSFLGYQSVGRWNGKLQRFEIRALVPRPVYRTDRLEGYAALQKSLQTLRDTKLALLPEAKDELHLERFALHGAVTLKRRWVPTR